MKLSSIAITTALLVATVTGCGGSSDTSRDDSIAELLASAAADGVNNEDFVAASQMPSTKFFEQNHVQKSLTIFKTKQLAKNAAQVPCWNA